MAKSNSIGRSLVALLGTLSALAAGGLLLELGEAIWLKHALGTVDLRVFQWLQDQRSPVLDWVFLSITRLGDATALTAVAVVCAAILLQDRRRRAALAVAGCFVSAALSVWAMKWLLQRSRPLPEMPLLTEHNPAFPSGHAAMSLVVYVCAAYLIAQRLGTFRQRVMMLAAGLGCAFLVGVSRLYLGVHWLSDVLGGYALGGVWLALLVTLIQQRRFEPAATGRDPGWRGLGWLLAALMLFLVFYVLGWAA